MTGESKAQLKQLLGTASDLGVQLVAIKMPHPLLPGSESFPWPGQSMFAAGRYIEDWSGYPVDRGCVVWELAKRTNLWGGCGNSNQVQLAVNNELPQSVWQIQADGWVRIA